MNTDPSPPDPSGLAAIIAVFAEAGWPIKVLAAVLVAIIVAGALWVAVLLADVATTAPTAHLRGL